MSEHRITFGRRNLTVGFAALQGKKFNELPEILEGLYEDVSVPSNVQYVSNGEVVAPDDEIMEGDTSIDIRAQADKKGI